MWNPDAYLRFAEERTRPAQDLCQRVLGPAPHRILDAGCGPGNSTRILRERWPSARITGLDSSPAMIAKARQLHPEGDWLVADLRTYRAAPFDLVFSNAVLQWLPGHAELLPGLMALVAPGGSLAVQVPSGAHAPVREAMAAAARDPRFRAALDGAGAALTFHDARFYHEHLAPLASSLEVWSTTYYHDLPGHQAILDWWESTGMRPYLERLEDPLDQARFKELVLAGCREAYPLGAEGRLLMPFERLFFVARKQLHPDD